MRRRAVVAALAALLSLLAGCGGGGGKSKAAAGTSPTAWANAVCGAVGDWQSTISTRATNLASEVKNANADAAQGRQILLNFLNEAIGETDRMLSHVREAGSPSVDRGGQIATDFYNGLAGMSTALKGARDTTAAAPATPAGVEKAGNDVAKSMDATGAEIGKTFDAMGKKYPNTPELDTAFASPACKRLG